MALIKLNVIILSIVILLDISKDLLISVGCDCHGAFTNARMFQIEEYPLLNVRFDK